MTREVRKLILQQDQLWLKTRAPTLPPPRLGRSGQKTESHQYTSDAVEAYTSASQHDQGKT